MIDAYLTDTITRIPQVAGEWGATTDGATSSVPARPKSENVLTRDSKGEEVLATVSLMVKPGALVVGDHFSLTGESLEYEVIQVKQIKDFIRRYDRILAK